MHRAACLCLAHLVYSGASNFLRTRCPHFFSEGGSLSLTSHRVFLKVTAVEISIKIQGKIVSEIRCSSTVAAGPKAITDIHRPLPLPPIYISVTLASTFPLTCTACPVVEGNIYIPKGLRSFLLCLWFVSSIITHFLWMHQSTSSRILWISDGLLPAHIVQTHHRSSRYPAQ